MKRKPTEMRQAEIVDAAMHIIATQGAKKFTAQLIADEIGLSAGAIFRHFKSMDEIVDAVIDRMDLILFENFPQTGDGPLDRLEAFFLQRFQNIAKHKDLTGLLLADHMAHLGGKEPAVRITAMKRKTQQFVRQCLNEAFARKEISNKISVAAASTLVMGAILAAGHAAPRSTSKAAVQNLAQEVWTAIEKMLCP